MEDLVFWIVIGIVIISILVFIVYNVIVMAKMSPEEKKKTLITYLKGLVALAEYDIGSGHGAEKLALVEKLFKEKAPFVYKIIFMLLKQDGLKSFIEEALIQVKESFEKKELN